MPIVGMTRREDVTPKFPDLGKLRKGGPKTDPKRPGPDLDHWRFTSERRDVQAAFDTAYGDKPALIEAYLPFQTMEENWATWFEEYDHGGMVHRCDGQTMYRWRNGGGEYVDGERPCPYFSGTKQRTKENPGCKQVGRLNLIVPQLIRAGFVGFVAMETHSINDLVSITACLIDAERKAGKLSGILFNVIRVKQTISTPAWKEEDKAAGKRNRTVKDLVKIVPAADWVMARLQLEAEQQMALASGKQLQLEAGDDYEDVEDGEYTSLNGNGHIPEAEKGGTDGHAPLQKPQPAGIMSIAEAQLSEAPQNGNGHDADAKLATEFDASPNAGAERAAADIKARVVGVKREDDTKAHTDMRTNFKKNLAIAIGNSDERHALCKFLFGSDEAETWTQSELMAANAWLGVGTAGKDENGKPQWAPGAKFLDDWKIIKAVIAPSVETVDK